MKRSIYILLLVLSFLSFKNDILAESFSMSISCPEVVIPGDSVTCTTSINTTDFTIEKIQGNYSSTGDITLNTTSFSLENLSVSSFSNVGSITVNIPSAATSNTEYTVSINSILANDTITSSDVSSSMRVISSDNNLSSLNLSGAIISFDSNITSYDVIIDAPKTTISAQANDSHSSVTGTGEKTLNYGLNSYEITVTSEKRVPKIYTINITRPDTRSKNCSLSSLLVSNTNINFDKNITEYNLSTISSEVTISATRDDSKQVVTGDTGKKSLSYGLNKFSIKVTAENGTSKTYILNITRNDVRSDNNYLKNLTLSSGSIKFSKIITTYNIDVDKSVEKIKINATLDDSKASFVNGFGSREVNLSLGNNTIYIKVQNEKGELRTYTLNINRDDGRNSDSTLKELKLSDAQVDFRSDKYDYTINVDYKVEKITITATPNSDKSKVTIDGDENLKVGTNIFKINVEAENGAKSTYTITINRKKDGYELSSNNYIKKLTITNYDLDFNKKKYNYTITTRDKSLKLDVILEDDNASYEIIGNENLKDGSKILIKVTAEDSSLKTYILTIEKPSNTLVILIMIFVTLVAASLITWIILKIKKRQKIMIQKQKDQETIQMIEDDFTKVD